MIPDVIVKKANQFFPKDIQCEYRDNLVFPIDSVSSNEEYSVFHLYRAIYEGTPVEFDLCESELKPCFELDNFSVSTKDSFIRRISC